MKIKKLPKKLLFQNTEILDQVKRTSKYEKGDKVGTRYNKEYEQYYIYALEQFLINTYGYSEYDAKVKVMQDFDEVKEDFELKEIK